MSFIRIAVREPIRAPKTAANRKPENPRNVHNTLGSRVRGCYSANLRKPANRGGSRVRHTPVRSGDRKPDAQNLEWGKLAIRTSRSNRQKGRRRNYETAVGSRSVWAFRMRWAVMGETPVLSAISRMVRPAAFREST